MTCLYFNASMQRSKADTFALTYLHKSILILLSGIPVLKDVLCIAWSNEIGNFVEECFWFSSIYCLKWCKMKYIWSSCACLLSTCVCDHRRFSLRRWGALAPRTEKNCMTANTVCVFRCEASLLVGVSVRPDDRMMESFADYWPYGIF